MSEQITWQPKEVLVAELHENLNNPKTVTEEGKKRLKKSIAKFGFASAIIVNEDLTIIDGHSRKRDLEQQGVEKVWVSFPSRMLTEKEYKEFNAIFDHARASDIDKLMTEKILDEDVLDEWDLNASDKPKKKQAKGEDKSTVVEAKYPLVPQYDERHEAIIILCSRAYDTTFIKEALGIAPAMSYKNSTVKQTLVVTSTQFIEKWKSK